MRKTTAGVVFFSVLVFAAGFTLSVASAAKNKGGSTETCKTCHLDRYNNYLGSIHANKGISKSPANKDGCESCHGDGADHILKGGAKGMDIFIFGKKRVDPDAKSAKCTECHGESRSLAFWDMSRHKAAGISCDNCHTVHSGKRLNLKTPQPDLCIACHRDIRGQIAKQSHHPLREGKMKCTDCHEQHGGFGQKMVKGSSVNELCYKCHAEKRGPFFWEHPPVAENCSTCHTVHGSNHGKLLTSRAPQLCQSCHDATQHPGTIYTSFSTFQRNAPTNRMYARSCLNCHSQVHGSSGPSARGQTLVR